MNKCPGCVRGLPLKDEYHWIDGKPIEVCTRIKHLAADCLKVFEKAAAANSDLWGYSVLDLMCDNFDNSVSDLKKALKLSGIKNIANHRIVRQIENLK